MKQRKLDTITPSFRLTKEQIEDTKRVLTDPEYAKKCDEERKIEEEKHFAELKQTILTGIGKNGKRLPGYFIKELADTYEQRTGERLNYKK